MDDNHEINEMDILNYFYFMSTEDVPVFRQKTNLLIVYRHLVECGECYDKYYILKCSAMDPNFMDENPDFFQFSPNFELLSQNEKLLENLIRN